MRRVTIIQRILYQYRVDFYKKLKDYLLRNDIELQLLVEENRSQDKMNFLDFFCIKKCWHFYFLKEELIFQPYLHFLNNSDLVILELGNKLVLNYVLILRRIFLDSKKIAFWGLASNMQICGHSLKNKLKRLYFKRADWWFPYTEGVGEIIKNAGFPSGKITTIYNTTDVERTVALKKSIDEESTEVLRGQLNIPDFPVGIFCGRMYKEKRVDFLLSACLRIKERYPDFTMIFIGGGPDAYKVENAAKQHRWIKYLGPLYDREKVAYFKLADVFLSPGLVGLSITESFALEVPMITTNYPYHSAEMEYLKNGENGIVTEDNLDCYVKEISEIFGNRERLEKLKRGCRETAGIYTMDNMVRRLTEGIKRSLDL